MAQCSRCPAMKIRARGLCMNCYMKVMKSPKLKEKYKPTRKVFPLNFSADDDKRMTEMAMAGKLVHEIADTLGKDNRQIMKRAQMLQLEVKDYNTFMAEKEALAIELFKQGYSIIEVMEETGLSRDTSMAIVARNHLHKPRKQSAGESRRRRETSESMAMGWPPITVRERVIATYLLTNPDRTLIDIVRDLNLNSHYSTGYTLKCMCDLGHLVAKKLVSNRYRLADKVAAAKRSHDAREKGEQ